MHASAARTGPTPASPLPMSLDQLARIILAPFHLLHVKKAFLSASGTAVKGLRVTEHAYKKSRSSTISTNKALFVPLLSKSGTKGICTLMAIFYWTNAQFFYFCLCSLS